MQPPFQVTGDPNIDWVIFIGGFFVCLYWLRALRLAQEGARPFIKNLLTAIVVFYALMAILIGTQQKTQLSAAQEEIIAGFVALIFFGRWQSQKRSRYIPKSVRRAVIARDLKGEEFDSQKHHIDHVYGPSPGVAVTPSIISG